MAKRNASVGSSVPVSLSSVVKYSEALPNPRHHRNRLHLLADVITIAVCGVIVGCRGPSAIECWAKCKKDWLGGLLELPHGIPSRDCIRRVWSTLKPGAFQRCFEWWIASLVNEVMIVQPIVAVDGKTMRRSHDHKNGLGPLHMVSARGHGARTVARTGGHGGEIQ